MPAYDFVTVDVFTGRRFGGNPLAVFPDASGLAGAQMQAIAGEFNLSETTFVLPPEDPANRARVRIFTPRTEMPFAGHPNVGAGFVLARLASDRPERYTFEELAGLVRVGILRDAEGAVSGAQVSAPRPLSLGIAIPADLVAACAGLSPDDIVTGTHAPVVASVGTPFVIAEVASLDALGRASPALSAFRDGASRFPDLAERFNVLVYARINEDAPRLRSRMFAPLSGVLEDPATGSANAALAALLTSLAPGEDVNLRYEIEQGMEMGRPSQIIASARKTAEGGVHAAIAGSCVPVTRGTLEL